MNNNDLIGAELMIYDTDAGTSATCATLDGSGFYSCGMKGNFIIISNNQLGSKITICDLTFYEEENLTK